MFREPEIDVEIISGLTSNTQDGRLGSVDERRRSYREGAGAEVGLWPPCDGIGIPFARASLSTITVWS